MIILIFMYNTLYHTERKYLCIFFIRLVKVMKRRIKTEAVLLQGEQIVGKTIILWSETKENKFSKLPR